VSLDPRSLRPGELCRALNSTPLGEVVTERQLHRQRMRAGFRIGDGRTIDLFRYVAWLASVVHAPRPERAPQLEGYDAVRERARARSLALSLSGRDIGELPEVVDPQRKEKAIGSFREFCGAYFPATFDLPWSDDHLKVISKIERAVLEGGLFAMAMPRASGKTSLCETACIWAMLTGARRFICLIGSGEDHAAAMLESIKYELEHNERLLEDFPEAVHPIHCLEGIHQRASGQLYRGQPTSIGWTAKEVVLPAIPGSAASGAIISVMGLTGNIRGMKHKTPDGRSVRPSLVLIDDPQTDESARSPAQCATRERILAGAILGLAGPGQKIAGLMTLTVVRPDDMADRLLDRQKHPQWQGERTKMVYAFPSNEALWQRYAELRADGLRNDRGIAEATEFYRRNQSAMDDGAVVAWPARFNDDEVSAVQHAMNLRLQDEAAFWAEYQNEPLPESTADDELLSADEIAAKVNGHARGDVPHEVTRLTMSVDVQGKLLYWTVVGWDETFGGHVIDYGTWPDQKIRDGGYFTLRDARRTLQASFPRAGQEAAINAGLEQLMDQIAAKDWFRNGEAMRVERCLVDANWGSSTDVVYQFCRRSRHAAILLPSHGRYVGASSIPLSDAKRRRGERVGLNWRVPPPSGRRGVRHALFDSNYWKSFIHARLRVAIGDPGCLSLFGQAPATHRMLADHLTSEYRVPTEARGRRVDEWKLKPGRPDNHWLDCLVGCAVAASMQGIVLHGTSATPGHGKQRLKLSELRKRRR